MVMPALPPHGENIYRCLIFQSPNKDTIIHTFGGGLVSYFVPDKANKGASCINLEKLNFQ